MSDAAGKAPVAASGGGGGAAAAGLGQTLRGIAAALRSSEILVALGMFGILVMLILPIPAWFLDIGLTLSITFSVLILMTALFIEKPLQLSSFPMILLIATMLRLSLNVASTKLILANGHTGTDAAGDVIQAFGTLLMAGNVIIGIIAFAILIIVNFIVITKGSGRIAEVAARFTLDAMPGKQMAIDADLSSGLINEDQARDRRKTLEQESTFFGSMDGAAKFVRGDAVAGLLITFINIIGGIIIGVAMNGMSFMDATGRYTILTVGDGLVSQIPALIVSTAAGILVTKAGLSGKTDQALVGQLGHYPRAVGVSSAVLVTLAILPGLPAIPFLAVGGALGAAAVLTSRRQAEQLQAEEELKAQQAIQTATKKKDEPITAALALDQVRLELGYGLLPLINDEQGYRLTDQIKALRRQLASDFGFVMPSVRILDNMNLSPNAYLIKIKEVVSGEGEVRPGMLLVMDPQGRPVGLPGEETTEPAFGLPATWIDQGLKEEANFRGYTAVDAATVVTTHLTEVIKDNMPDLLSFAETQKLLDDLPKEQQKLVADLIPNTITVNGVQRVLQSLLSERVSIRDLPTILEGIAEAASFTKNAMIMTEHVRMRLARQISNAQVGPQGYVPLLSLSPKWEQAFAESLVGQGEERQLAMPPSQLQEFINTVRGAFDKIANSGEIPALLTSPGIRPYVRSIVERFRPATTVLSQAEIHPKARIRTLGQV
ncbi:MAG: flagellar biosynthesis protein FlhA [Rhodothalassiaceae bacterium]